MTFGAALERAKIGQKIQREGWNGKSMFVAYIGAASASIGGVGFTVAPFLVLKTAQDTYVPWTASQSDMLAEDWAAI